MIKSNLRDIETIYTHVNGVIRELTQIMCNGQELWSGFEPFSIDFSYTGDIQSWTVPKSGLYLLTCNGAQGGAVVSTGTGGQGGITKKYTYLKKGTVLYIVCGGKKYNGGGTGFSNTNEPAGHGGGATHIATKAGLLSTLTISDILAVAGGGGGAGSCNISGTKYSHVGGKGGGVTGQDGRHRFDNYGLLVGGGGTQTSPGKTYGTAAAFGQGGNGKSSTGGGGGGGGLYGGGGGAGYNGPSAGGGGSGYIGEPTTTYKGKTYINSTEQGGHKDNGSASITRIA